MGATLTVCGDGVASSREPNLVISFDGEESRKLSPKSSSGMPTTSKSGIEKPPIDGAKEGVGRVNEGVATSGGDARISALLVY